MAIEIHENVPLAPLTTFKIGGSAQYFVSVWSDDDLREALAWAREKRVDFAILGGGSNVLVADAGFDGLVIHLVEGGVEFSKDSPRYGLGKTVLAADAGCNLLSLIRVASEKGCGGWEKLAGIPGTIGGAARGNAGAFGSEIKDFVTTVRAFNAATEETREFSNAECDFSYRRSFFKDHPEWLITRVALQLSPVDPADSKKLAEDTIAEREKRHLQNVRAAGSYFMNPVAPSDVVAQFEQEKGVKARGGRVPAGWLIEKAGMKGATVGDAMASLQHPNYIVNTGNATAEDVRKLAAKIKIAVHEKFGVTLTEEAAIL
jgi:UDP-N-acetylmuramate dehydrogenase